MDVLILSGIGAVMSLLFAGNLYFIRKLVEKIELTALTVNHSALTVAELKIALSNYSEQIKDMKMEFRELRKIEVEVKALQMTLLHRGFDVQVYPSPKSTPSS